MCWKKKHNDVDFSPRYDRVRIFHGYMTLMPCTNQNMNPNRSADRVFRKLAADYYCKESKGRTIFGRTV